MQKAPVLKDLVLVGGGHSHVAVVKRFGMRPLPGVRVTLISRNSLTPYSGMLPGLIAGRYSVDEAHIDLVPLCRFAGARFIRAEVSGVDPAKQTVLFADRPPVAFDVLSINSGSTPSLPEAGDADGSIVPVKPIDRFLERFEPLVERLRLHEGTPRIGIVGGGAGGVELALSVEHRLTSLGLTVAVELLTDDSQILTTHNRGVQTRFRRILAKRGIEVHTDSRVVEAHTGGLRTQNGEEFPFDEVLWVTNAAAAPWLAASGLEVDSEGFLLVDATLQSTSHPDIFGAGDAAAMRDDPRPKSGVFAVRQGRPLARNLRNALLGRALRAYRPQREFLSLIGTGKAYAVASRGTWSAEGRWVWNWKDGIDRRFMERYQQLPEMGDSPPGEIPRALGEDPARAASGDGMRCGGCGAKVGAETLQAALAGIKSLPREDVVVGLEAPDDAALVRVPADKLSVLSVDAFRPMVEDPYVFGQITANHCLNDLFAIGAEAQTAMTIVTLPLWHERKLAEELRQMLAGALNVFSAEGAALVGGHTSEGAELSLGFSVTGLIDRDAALLKRGMRAGDVLILTKAVGTGAIFAADMRAKAKGVWVDAAIESMLKSNAAAAACLHGHGARACTDVTGFGLFGHLLEMVGDERLTVRLDADALPLLDGALESIRAGLESSLQPDNERLAGRADVHPQLAAHPHYPLLFDPQTAGGLLAAVPAGAVDGCIQKLRELGYERAATVGMIAAGPRTRRAAIVLQG